MTHYDKRGGGVAKYGVISPLGVMNNGRMPLMDGRHPFSPIRPSPSFSFAMKRAAWDGVRLYAGPINAYQQFANAFVAAAQPAFGSKDLRLKSGMTGEGGGGVKIQIFARRNL